MTAGPGSTAGAPSSGTEPYDPADDELPGDELADDDLDGLAEDRIDDADDAGNPDIIVAEVVDVAPSLEPDTGRLPASRPAGTPEDAPAGPALSEQWHEIQVMFVDDPGGAVRLAAQAAETAVRTVVTTLERQQASLPRPDAAGGTAPDTEQLRTALREFRSFSQRMAELAASLP